MSRRGAGGPLERPRAATLVLRAWREPDDPGGPVRVRIVEVATTIASGGRARVGERTRCATASAGHAAAEVAAWLEELRGRR